MFLANVSYICGEVSQRQTQTITVSPLLTNTQDEDFHTYEHTFKIRTFKIRTFKHINIHINITLYFSAAFKYNSILTAKFCKNISTGNSINKKYFLAVNIFI